jgi:DNA-binding MarR family transcriptional regulator
MRNSSSLEKQKFVLSKLFLLPNKLQVLGNQIFGGDMTLKQWLLTVAIAQCRGKPPTIGKLAELMGCSYQNVKQIALKLKKGGFLIFEKSENDLSVTCLKLTEKSRFFWESRHKEINQYLEETFKDLKEEEINLLCECMNKLYDNVLEIEKVKLI